MTLLDTALRGTGKTPIKLERSWYRASDRYGFAQTGLHLGALVVVLALATPLWLRAGPLAAILLVLPLGVLIYKLTIVLHDCAHMTLFRTRRYNRWVGRLTGCFLGSEFSQFQAQHFLHHRAFGQAGDPQGPDYLGLQAASRSHVLWHLLRPLLGFNLIKLLYFQPPGGGRPDRPAQKTSLPRKLRFLVGTGAVQLAILALATGFGTVWWNALLYPAAAATVALFLSQLRGFCEHVTPVPAADESFVRTHRPNLVDRTLFYGLNFNFHVEHHLYPAVPSCQLPRLHKTHGNLFHTPQSLSSSILETVRTRLAQCPT